jgi:hypothetical protein
MAEPTLSADKVVEMFVSAARSSGSATFTSSFSQKLQSSATFSSSSPQKLQSSATFASSF